MSEKGCIYLITNTLNGRRYVGQTKYPTPLKRYKSHWHAALKNPNTPLYVDMQQYGKENFTLETLCSVPRDHLNDMEAYWAEQLCTYIWDKSLYYPRGYNIKPCGTGLSNTDDYAYNLATSVKNAIKRRGEYWWKGRTHKPETIEKMRQINLGRKHTPEAIIKIGNSHRGKKASPELRAKLSASHKGRTQTKEHNEKARINRIESVIKHGAKGVKLTKETVLSIIKDVNAGKSQTEVAAQHDVQISVISRIMSGDRWGQITGIERKEPIKRGHAKLGMETANQIRKEYAFGNETYVSLADKYGVNNSTIANIVKGKLYKP